MAVAANARRDVFEDSLNENNGMHSQGHTIFGGVPLFLYRTIPLQNKFLSNQFTDMSFFFSPPPYFW